MINVTVIGAEEFGGKLRTASPAIKQEIAAELYRQAESVMAESKEHYVPVDLGVLRASGHVRPPVITDDAVSVTLGFGGAAGAYAVIQHERMDFRHTTGGPKYLERPLLAAVSRIRSAIADAFRRGLSWATSI